MELPLLNLPTYPLRRRYMNGSEQIFDAVRHRWVALTPEEWVRQHVVAHLVALKYPIGRISNEFALTFNGQSRRCDTVVFDVYGRPLLIVEYKAPYIAITQAVFDQVAVYALQLNVPFLLLSNGLTHVCCKIDRQQRRYLFAAQPFVPYEQLCHSVL